MLLTRIQKIVLITLLVVVIIAAILVPVLVLVVFKKSSDKSLSETAMPDETSATPTIKPAVPIVWAFKQNTGFAKNTWKAYTIDTIEGCRDYCGVGCDFFTYASASSRCELKFMEKTAVTGTKINGVTSGMITGMLRYSPNVKQATVTDSNTCFDMCSATAGCEFATYQANFYNSSIACRLNKFDVMPGVTLGFRTNTPPLNNNETVEGRFDVIGNTGVVAIMTNLLPNGKILFTARPEYFRGPPTGPIRPNPDALLRANVPYGEIASIFDPATGKAKPSPIDDNLFCHASILMEDGTVFTAGGDESADIERLAGLGLVTGLKKTRIFNPTTELWTYLNDMTLPRWYPTIVRLPDGRVFIFGGSTDGTAYEQQYNVEIWQNGVPKNPQFPINVLAETGTALYAQMHMVPHTGHIFIFTYQKWAMLNPTTMQEYEREQELVQGVRGGDYLAASMLLPLSHENNFDAEFIIFGGAASPINEVGIDTVARLKLNTVGPKHWTYDTERMPYGRIVSDVVMQPNGKMLIVNGGRLGKTGAFAIGGPYLNASAVHAFLYDPKKPDGQRWSVMAESPIRRLYHSSAVLLPDGRTLISGTDQATFESETSYEHRAEAWTPPWLLKKIPRPVIVSVTQGVIKYGTTFTVKFTGKVTGVSLMTPGAVTHGVEFTSRLIWPKIESQTADELVIRAPPDATIMLQGYHMVFLLNGDTPSVAAWIKLGN
eukprot:Partr_v1_DN28581_c0_g1_i4_m72602 putative Glyoxal oxidase